MAAAELKDALQTASEIDLTVTGRRSGREISRPVWFVIERDVLYLLPVGGSASEWYRNVLKTPTIRIAANGVETGVQARPVTDASIVNDVVDMFRAKYGTADVDRYYPTRDVAVEIVLA